MNVNEVHGPAVPGGVAIRWPAVGPVASAAVKTGAPVMGSVKAIMLLAGVCFPVAPSAMTVASYFPPGMSPTTTASGVVLVTTMGLELGWPDLQHRDEVREGVFQKGVVPSAHRGRPSHEQWRNIRLHSKQIIRTKGTDIERITDSVVGFLCLEGSNSRRLWGRHCDNG